MIEVTSVHYKEMGNISSNVKPVTKSPDLKSDLISDSVNHASSNQIKSSSSSSVKSGVSSGDSSKTSDHCCSRSNSSSIDSEEEEEEETEKEKELPINDSETSKICETNSILPDTSDKNSKPGEEKGNNVKVATNPITSSLNHWNDHQQPSTSKAKVITVLPYIRKEIPPEEETEEEEETESSSDFESDILSNYTGLPVSEILIGDKILTMPKPRPLGNFNPRDDDVITFDSDEDEESYKSIGDFSRLLEHLVNGDMFIGPRSQHAICNDTGTDSDSNSDYENSAGKANNPTHSIMPSTPKEDLGELGIPRTQKINKDGDPVLEKCKCHHHQVGSTKLT